MIEPLHTGNENRLKEAKHFRECTSDLVGFRVDIGIEECARHNRQRQRHHLSIHVDRLPIAPSIARHPGAIHHFTCVRGDALAVKGGLHESTLTQVKLAFARQEAFTEQHLRALQHVSFHECALVCDENVAHIIGVSDEVHSQVTNLRSSNVPLRAMQGEEEPREVAANSNDVGEP
jgi:hypothetical protein